MVVAVLLYDTPCTRFIFLVEDPLELNKCLQLLPFFGS